MLSFLLVDNLRRYVLYIILKVGKLQFMRPIDFYASNKTFMRPISFAKIKGVHAIYGKK